MLVRGISKRPFPGLVNFVSAVAYLFCLNMPAAFSQPGNGLIEIPCRLIREGCQEEKLGKNPVDYAASSYPSQAVQALRDAEEQETPLKLLFDHLKWRRDCQFF